MHLRASRPFALSLLLACLALATTRLPAADVAASAAPPNTVYAEVVALDQPWWFNRLGAAQPGGMMFALKRDVVPSSGSGSLQAGAVALRPDKRPRPITLRVNRGQFLEINFTNLLSPSSTQDGVATRVAGLHIAGLELVSVTGPDGVVQPGINSDATWVGKNPNAYAPPYVKPGDSRTYKYYAKAEGTFFLYSAAADWSGQLPGGLFGAAIVEPSGAEWYRSQVTNDDMILAARKATVEPSGNRAVIDGLLGIELVRKVDISGKNVTTMIDETEVEVWTLSAIEPARQTVHQTDAVIRNGRLFTPDGRPLIDYNAVYPVGNTRAGQPILKMTQRRPDGRDELIATDLTAIITGPNAGDFPFTENGPGFYANPSLPSRRQPFREFTIMYHEIFATVQQAFPQFNSPQLGNVLGAGGDAFAINYGAAGIGAEVLASRLGVGPMGGKQSVDLKFEEFFLSSWSNGDPAMVVDVPANTTTNISTGGLVPPTPTSTPTAQPNGERATKAFYADDPSNVYHSYMRDHVTMRLLHTGSGVTHVHHLHAHQWLRSPNDDNSHYLDSQLIAPGSTYTLEMVYNGSGNRNETVGDSIFHCHFYPHFAGGMWALWRVHDVFEAGTLLDKSGRPRTDIPNRALPDAEIVTGTPIPGLVPLPTLAMAPAPAPLKLIENGTRVDVAKRGVTPTGEPIYDNPGYPFFVPGVAGHRAPHPPLDFGWEEDRVGHPKLDPAGKKIYLDGGLPRHLVLDGLIVNEQHTRWDFSKDFIAYDKTGKPIGGSLKAFELPEEGTAVEKAAMTAHATRTHASYLPNGDPGNFILNGLPPVPGAPFANPSVDDNGNAQINTRRYQAAAMQLDVVLSKQGWHYPQQRFLSLWQDVASNVKGERAPQPLFFRANTGETIEFWHTNLVPDYYDLDDFQVRTPTDIIGQHIHLVKFDVTSSDGAGNGWNYEDGTFSPDEVRGRIDAINLYGGLHNFDLKTQFAGPNKRTLAVKPAPKVFGDAPAGQNWAGAQTTIQRWDTDPVENNKGEDRTLRTVFTHDHFGPSTHQQVGLYGGLLVEPEGSKWYDPITGGLLYDTKIRSDGGPTSWQANILPANRTEAYREFALEFADFQLAYLAGSPATPKAPAAPLFTAPLTLPPTTSTVVPDASVVAPTFAANGVVLSSAKLSASGNNWILTNTTAPRVEQRYTITPTATAGTYAVFQTDAPHSWSAPLFAINPPAADANNQNSGGPYPTLISTPGAPGTFALNYRIEPIPARVWDPKAVQPAAGPQGDLSLAYASMQRADPALNQQPIPGTPINPAAPKGFKFPANIVPTLNGPGTVVDPSAAQPTDPFTPLLRAYAGDKVQVRTLVGAHHNPHYFSMDGVKWLYEPGSENTGFRNNQPMGISEHYEMMFTLPTFTAATERPFADYLYNPSAGVDGITNGAWGIMRSYKRKVDKLEALPNNPPPATAAAMDIKPPPGAKIRKFSVVATTAKQALPNGTLVYNSRGQSGITPAQPITNPNALIYVRAEDLNNGKLNPNLRAEPLILRAAAGEWIELTLTNQFQPTTLPAVFSAGTAAQAPYGNMSFFTVPSQGGRNFSITPDVIARFKAAGYTVLANATVTPSPTAPPPVPPITWTITPPAGTTGPGNMDYILTLSGNDILVSPTIMTNASPQVGLNPQVVGYDITRADGVTIGFNPIVAVPPGGKSQTIYWYAGTIDFVNGQMRTTPVELGAINLNPSDPLLQHTQGLVGALVIEPEGSSWVEDPKMRAAATVTKADGKTFRDFVMIAQDDLALSWGPANNPTGTTTHAVNYGTEPMSYRFTSTSINGDVSNATSNTLVNADPQTPIYTAVAGSEVRFRMLHPASGSGADGETFTIDGHVFQEEPYTNDSRTIGDNPLSQWFGTRGGHGARNRFEIVLASAGGEHKVPGDYLYRSLVTLGTDFVAGKWGIFRVTPAPGQLTTPPVVASVAPAQVAPAPVTPPTPDTAAERRFKSRSKTIEERVTGKPPVPNQ